MTVAWRREYLLLETAAAAEPGTNEFDQDRLM
jgi:hypothetical protein